MSQANVELARSFLEATERAMGAYWDNPHSLAETLERGELEPEDEALWRHIDPEVVWDTGAFGVYRGQLEIARAWDEIFEIADSYSTTVRELTDCGGDRVFAAIDRTITGKGSGIHTTIPVFAVITFSDGLVTHAVEYPDRAQAVADAGLPDT